MSIYNFYRTGHGGIKKYPHKFLVFHIDCSYHLYLTGTLSSLEHLGQLLLPSIISPFSACQSTSMDSIIFISTRELSPIASPDPASMGLLRTSITGFPAMLISFRACFSLFWGNRCFLGPLKDHSQLFVLFVCLFLF